VQIHLQGDKILALTKAAGLNVQTYWPDLFARLASGGKEKALTKLSLCSALAKKDINDLLMSASSGSAPGELFFV
jgi:hypothetical protein